MMSAVVYLTLGTLLAGVFPRRKQKLYILTVSLILTGLVGVSRVFMGVHYPTDVLAGWTAGLVWATLCWLTVVWLERRGVIVEPLEATSHTTEARECLEDRRPLGTQCPGGGSRPESVAQVVYSPHREAQLAGVDTFLNDSAIGRRRSSRGR